jgi:hypothetical protein
MPFCTRYWSSKRARALEWRGSSASAVLLSANLNPILPRAAKPKRKAMESPRMIGSRLPLGPNYLQHSAAAQFSPLVALLPSIARYPRASSTARLCSQCFERNVNMISLRPERGDGWCGQKLRRIGSSIRLAGQELPFHIRHQQLLYNTIN